MNTPTPQEIRAARLAAGLTPTQAAELIHRAARTWLQYEQGVRQIDGAGWELFNLKINKKPLDKISSMSGQ